ncbi:hypothetical protein CGCVW01_v001043 [Colletotrichum viniferum]|nr:hypothetical protein CGCVW01_v001043 [Colletotrichum viniferum]
MEPCNPTLHSKAPLNNGSEPNSHFRFTDLPTELRCLILEHILDDIDEESNLDEESDLDEESNAAEDPDVDGADEVPNLDEESNIDEESSPTPKIVEIIGKLNDMLVQTHKMSALLNGMLALGINVGATHDVIALNNDLLARTNDWYARANDMFARANNTNAVPDNLAREVELEYPQANMLAEHELVPKPPKLSTLACVSKEWQRFFEQYTFNSLDVTLTNSPAEIEALGEMVKGYRRTFVEEIVLNIELPGNSSGDVQVETEKEIRRNNALFTMAVFSLFKVLANWTGPEHDHGLALHINVMSADDVEDWPPRMQGSLLDFKLKKLPLVPIVDELLWMFHSESTRSASANAMSILLKSMNHLTRVVYHPHCSQLGEDQSLRDDAFLALFQKHRGWVKRMVVRESAYLLEEHNPYTVKREDLALACFHASLHLESLITSRVVDAFDFFRCTGDLGIPKESLRQVWPELNQLVLSCNLSNSSFDEDMMDTVLLAAGKAAMRMPKLEKMIIWSWDAENYVGFFFGYGLRCSKLYPAFIDIRTTWRSALNPEVVRCWEAAVTENTSYELTVQPQRLDWRDKHFVDALLEDLETSNSLLFP